MVPENIFTAAVLRLSIPYPSEATPVELAAQEPEKARQVAYYDEKLDYVVSMTLPHGAILPENRGEEEEREALERFLDLSQVTTSATFVPNLPPPSSAGPSRHQSSLQTPTFSAPPGSTALLSPRLPPSATDSASIIPPNTPNPMPQMDDPMDSKKRYAGLEGVVVWEGVPDAPQSSDKDGELSFRGKRRRKGADPIAILKGTDNDDWAWRVIWRGQVPIAYLRTPIHNPLLALTASLTLRPPHLARTHRRTNTVSSIDSMSLKSDDEGEEAAEDGESIAEMEEVDLLGGLADEPLPSTRLPPSLRNSLALPPLTPASAVSASAYTPQTAPDPPTGLNSVNANRTMAALPPQPAAVPPTTLRKSFRAILGLSSGLRVRMRTVILPQLLPLDAADDDDDDADAERRIVLCVEVESGLGQEGGEADGYEIERIDVDVGGKGGKVDVEMVQSAKGTQIFPMRLGQVDQHNLLYAMSPAANHDVNEGSMFGQGQGDLQRPVSITVVGRPYHSEGSDTRRYPAEPFSSRWNCTLDLSSFHQPLSAASLSTATLPPTGKLTGGLQTVAALPNQIVGDKRYSLASLMAAPAENNQSPRGQVMPKSARTVSGRGPVSAYGNTQPLPPSAMASAQDRSQDAYSDVDGEGLLVSVRLLPQGQPEGGPSSKPPSPVEKRAPAGTVKANEPFSIEIFVHNQTDEVRRLRIGAPGLELRRTAHQTGGIWAGKAGNSNSRTSDAALREQYLNHLDSAPALIALENDIRCGPLYPHTSQSARMRFIALRDGVHRIEKLRVVGVGPGDGFEYIMSPVIDVVVGNGIATC